MKKRIGYLFISVLVLCSVVSFKKIDKVEQQDKSVVLLKVKYNSLGMTGFGGVLKIRNVISNRIYENEIKMGMNPFIIITDVPTGDYTVEELQIISGSNRLTIRDTVSFNTLHVEASKIYYLGSYITKKVAPLAGLNFQVKKNDNDEEYKIYKQVKKKSENSLNNKIDFEHKLFKNDVTTIKI